MKLTDEQIGAELRALRELPSEDFAAQLDAWAAEGFPSLKQLKNPSRPRPRRSFIRRRPMVATLAGAAVIVAVVSVSVAAYLHQRDSSTLFSASGGDSGGAALSGKVHDQSLQQSAPATAGVSGEVAVPPAPHGSRPRNDRTQVQELSAAIGLSTDADKVQEASDGVVEVTNRYDGFVDSSDVHVGGDRSRASFSLRIPAADLRDALDDLSSLGRVVTRDEGSTNVTGAYVDAGKNYRDAQAKVDSLLEQLRTASDPGAAAAIRAQLDTARQELAAARAALRGIKQQVTYAPVTVQIRPGDGESGSWSIGDAADDAVGVLKAIAGGVLVTLAVLLPLVALLALGWLGTRELNRRRREAALNR